jgi:chemotaxis protein CheC
MVTNSLIAESIAEFINIGAGKAADSMNQLLGTHIKLSIPWVKMSKIETEELIRQCDCVMYGVKMRFWGSPQGYALMLFKKSEIPVLIDGLLGGEAIKEGDSALRDSAISELGNIVINAIIGSVCNMAGSQVTYEVPIIIEQRSCEIIDTGDSHFVMSAGTDFELCKYAVKAITKLVFGDHGFGEKLTKAIGLYH